jgi:hypothetical protein
MPVAVNIRTAVASAAIVLLYDNPALPDYQAAARSFFSHIQRETPATPFYEVRQDHSNILPVRPCVLT